jgi:hypothetical protein
VMVKTRIPPSVAMPNASRKPSSLSRACTMRACRKRGPTTAFRARLATVREAGLVRRHPRCLEGRLARVYNAHRHARASLLVLAGSAGGACRGRLQPGGRLGAGEWQRWAS